IVYLLSKEFTLLIIVAFIISAPVAYYIMHKWLQNYTYRIPLSASIFLLAIVSSIIIAWITVGQRAIKAAIPNPVKSLRTEYKFVLMIKNYLRRALLIIVSCKA